MFKTLSIISYLFMVAGMIGLFYTDSFFSASVIVIALQGAAVALHVWARATFGRRSFHAAANPTEGGLITTGPYRFIRHPIYASLCLFVVPGAVAHLSIVSGILVLLIVTGAISRMLAEERLLVERYPEYTAYAARTKRIVPWVM